MRALRIFACDDDASTAIGQEDTARHLDAWRATFSMTAARRHDAPCRPAEGARVERLSVLGHAGYEWNAPAS